MNNLFEVSTKDHITLPSERTSQSSAALKEEAAKSNSLRITPFSLTNKKCMESVVFIVVESKFLGGIRVSVTVV